VWERHVGDGLPQPTFSPATIGDFRVKIRATRVHDATVVDLCGVSGIRTQNPPGDTGDEARLYVVRSGAWTQYGPSDRGEHTVAAGQVLLRRVGRPSRFETAPRTTAKIVFLPAAMLTPLIGGQGITGPADAAEVRLLVAHANMVQKTMPDLSPAGVQAAHSTLIELAKAVVMRQFDDVEPRLAPALAQAARNLADSRLAEPELSAAMLARELHVSLRTLQRAFAATGEPVTVYIRDRRLEEARLALAVRSGRLSVSELAAHWRFADSSHFIRTFKKRYGQTPAEYARSAQPAANRTGE
jgi:AraC-like DNA-binding protein